MLSLLAGALLFTASTVFGMSLKNLFRTRYKIFAEATEFTNYLIREIEVLKTPLSTLIPEYFEGKKGVFKEMLIKYYGGMQYGYSGENDVYAHVKTAYLSADDNRLIAGFLYALGKSDVNSEITNLKRFNGIFSKKTAEYELHKKTKGEMYYKLFVLLGVTLMLLTV